MIHRADSRLARSQGETLLQSNAFSHWLDTNLESALIHNVMSYHNITLRVFHKSHFLDPVGVLNIINRRWKLMLKINHCSFNLEYFTKGQFLSSKWILDFGFWASKHTDFVYSKIPWILKAFKFGFRLFQTLWNLIGTSATALPRYLSNFRAIQLS